ncbi:MAG: UDP-3-O-(3-hydroxymyristoyl)glucosamine N-acyltransferase [Proteobacteria bacterium]|nr:UDP-3-O-(3-hydroxymyristoyl)glucosamine N-acyltransferase [Pseudomonadota bacterium]
MKLTLQQLATNLQLEYKGEADLEISGIASLSGSVNGDLSFIQHEKYARNLLESQCSAVIAPTGFDSEVTGKAVLFAENPRYSFIEAIGLIKPELVDSRQEGIHESAHISPDARLGANVSIGPLSVIGDGVVIGDNTSIGASCVIEQDAKIASDCRLHCRVTVGERVKIGNRCILHPGVVLGSDGFGLLFYQQKWEKIPQIGTVLLHDDVEIGANTTVDRGSLDDTIIEQGCKLDNLIQVAHNVRIGAHTAIAACVGIAGSAHIGSYCKISGAAVVLGHLTIVDHVTITAMSLVTKDIKKPGVYSSGTPLLENSLWHKNNVRYKSLDRLARTVAMMDKKQK